MIIGSRGAKRNSGWRIPSLLNTGRMESKGFVPRWRVNRMPNLDEPCVINPKGPYWARGHRKVYEKVFGKIPSNDASGNKLCVRHLCNVPSCVNPNHLALGTYTENMADKKMARKPKDHALYLTYLQDIGLLESLRYILRNLNDME